MANFITTSISWDGKENFDKLIRPLFIGKSPLNTQGIKIMSNIQSKSKLNYFGTVQKVLKAYSKGFDPATGSTFTQRDIDVFQMKGEWAQDANEFYKTVFEQGLAKGVDWNDLSKDTNQLQKTILEIFVNAIESDIYRQFWLNDTNKETLTAAGNYSGTADEDYNAYDGLWKRIFDDAAVTPTALQIKLVDIDNAAVKQVATVTITGTSGTATITFNGDTFLATFSSTLDITAAAFVTLHAAAILLKGVVLTNAPSGDDLLFTSVVPGQPFLDPTIANTTGDLDGSIASSTANTAPSALAADEILSTLRKMYRTSRAVLRGVPKKNKVFLMDGDSFENYLTTLEAKTSTAGEFTSERGRLQLIDGVEVLKYRGIPVINLDWDVSLDADFPHASGEITARSNRIIYTEFQNLILPIDALSEFSKFDFWFNKDEQENRYRIQLKSGANYTFNEVMTVAYEV